MSHRRTLYPHERDALALACCRWLSDHVDEIEPEPPAAIAVAVRAVVEGVKMTEGQIQEAMQERWRGTPV